MSKTEAQNDVEKVTEVETVEVLETEAPRFPVSIERMLKALSCMLNTPVNLSHYDPENRSVGILASNFEVVVPFNVDPRNDAGATRIANDYLKLRYREALERD